MKSGLEQASRSYDGALKFGKDTAVAMLRTATVAGKAAETINVEFQTYLRQAMDDAMTTTRAVMASKSIHEAMEFQADYAKTAFENYIGEWTKLGELRRTTAKDSYLPFPGRVNGGSASTKQSDLI